MGGEYHDCAIAGIQYNDSGMVGSDGNSGGIIRNAKIYRSGQCNGSYCHGGKSGIVLYSNQRNTKIYNNLVYDNLGGPGIAVGWTNSNDNEVYNNTIVGNTGYCIEVGTIYPNVDVLRTIVKNNICKNNGGGIRLNTYASNSQVQNNVIHGSSGVTNNSSGSVVSNNLLVDPLFVNILAKDFRLNTGSPAIDAGINLSAQGVTTDFIGTTRPQGSAYDIGAYELPIATFDFSLANSGNKTVQAGSSVTNTITATKVGTATSQSVAFSVSGTLPTGVTASFAPTACTPSTTCTSAMTLTTVSTATPGTYPITVRGTSGSLTKTTVFNLAVTVISAPTITLSATPGTITQGQTSQLSWSSTNTASCSAPWTISTATSGSANVTL